MRAWITSILIGLLLNASAALAAPPAVVLLTALDPHSGKGLVHGSSWNGNSALEKIFRQRFENSGYRLEVHHSANAETVWNSLHSPDNIAVFFVGHAASSEVLGSAGGFSSENTIADRNGNNLSDLFKSVHPNIRVLAIVGCKTSEMFKQFRTQGLYDRNPLLQILSFDHLIDPYGFPIELNWNSGLTQAINMSLDTLAKPQSYDELFPITGPCKSPEVTTLEDQYARCQDYYVRHRKVVMLPEFENGLQQACFVQRGFAVQITREIPSYLRDDEIAPLRMVVQNRIAGLFPQGHPGETQSMTVYFNPSEIRVAKDLKIIADTGLSIQNARKLNIGSLKIEAAWPGFAGSWRVMSDIKGAPLGVNKFVYPYSGPLPDLQGTSASAAVDYSPFHCD